MRLTSSLTYIDVPPCESGHNRCHGTRTAWSAGKPGQQKDQKRKCVVLINLTQTGDGAELQCTAPGGDPSKPPKAGQFGLQIQGNQWPNLVAQPGDKVFPLTLKFDNASAN